MEKLGKYNKEMNRAGCKNMKKMLLKVLLQEMRRLGNN